MKAVTRLLICAMVAAVATGCATVVTKKANLNEAPKGVRIYPPKVYLLVDTAEKKTTIAYLPDYSRAYDLKPLTIFAKQDFKIETDEGQLKALTTNQDTTAMLTFLKEAAALAAKSAGVAVSSTVINGTFGLESGIYQLGDDGVFRKMTETK
jgi:uncharacterized protein YceK